MLKLCASNRLETHFPFWFLWETNLYNDEIILPVRRGWTTPFWFSLVVSAAMSTVHQNSLRIVNVFLKRIELIVVNSKDVSTSPNRIRSVHNLRICVQKWILHLLFYVYWKTMKNQQLNKSMKFITMTGLSNRCDSVSLRNWERRLRITMRKVRLNCNTEVFKAVGTRLYTFLITTDAAQTQNQVTECYNQRTLASMLVLLLCILYWQMNIS